MEENKELEQDSVFKELFENIKGAILSFWNKERPSNPDDYLYVPDRNKPSTWKLPVHDKAHMALAAAALGKGLMGNKVDIPAGARAKARSKLRGMYKKMGMELPDSLKEAPMTVWKDDSGQWRWLAKYSNNFRDNDHPAEIISKESHENFVRMVDAGEAPMPELWHWHVRGSKWGQAEWVAYDSENGIAMAAGTIDPGHEKEAEALESAEFDVALSHGMPTASLQYDKEDRTIINRHITSEISDLPLWAAANKLTSFYVFKETDEMAIPEKKREYLKGINVSEEEIQAIEEQNAQTKQTAEEQHIESKEAAPAETPAAKTEETPQVEAKKEGEEVATETQPVQLITGDQLAEAVKRIGEIVAATVNPLAERLSVVEADMKEAKEKAAKETVDPRLIPAASLAALISNGMSVIGKPEAKATKKEVAEAGPEETAPNEDEKGPDYGNPFVNSVIRGITGK